MHKCFTKNPTDIITTKCDFIVLAQVNEILSLDIFINGKQFH